MSGFCTFTTYVLDSDSDPDSRLSIRITGFIFKMYFWRTTGAGSCSVEGAPAVPASRPAGQGRQTVRKIQNVNSYGMIYAGLWIRIHFFRIRILLFLSMRIRIQLVLNADPDPAYLFFFKLPCEEFSAVDKNKTKRLLKIGQNLLYKFYIKL